MTLGKRRAVILSTIFLAILAGMMICAPAKAQVRQTKLYIDDGTGKFTILKSSPLSGSQTINFPAVNSSANVILSNLTGGQSVNGGFIINGGATINGGLTVNGLLDLGTPLGATSGGTGFGSYIIGNLLYAYSATALSQLSIGATNQVLGVSGGIPAWTQNGATITNTVNSPTALTSTPINDYTIDGSSTYIRLRNASAGSIDLTGITSTGVTNGRVITLVNTSVNAIVIQSRTGSASGNQFDLPGGDDIILGQKGSATFIYDQASGYWELVSTN